MLIRQLVGSNAGMITDVEPDVAQIRVDSGSYEFLPESDWDRPDIAALVGKVPNAVQKVAAYSTTEGPAGYKVEAVAELGGTGWYVRDRLGKLLNYKPMPNKPAANDLAEKHHTATAAGKAAIEAQAVQDKADHEALVMAEEVRRRATARTGGF